MTICSVQNCDKPVHARNLCPKHYWRWRIHGNTSHLSRGRQFLENALQSNSSECILWPFTFAGGYPQTTISGKQCVASRWICERTHGPAPSKNHQAAHSCGKGHLGCISPHHLRWATQAENEADKIIHGTLYRGEQNGFAKLSNQDVQEIKLLLITGETGRNIAKKFNVSKSLVSAIKVGKAWGWLKPAPPSD